MGYALFLYQQVKERVLYMVVKNREKRVTGGGRRVIDVRQLERYERRKCGSGGCFPVFACISFALQSYEKILKLTNYKQKTFKKLFVGAAI